MLFKEDILMMSWLTIGVILGLVQGITEFLPVSSTGHLIIVAKFLHFTGSKASVFEVAVQLGSIMAVVVIYWNRFIGLIRPEKNKKFAGLYGIWLLFLTTLPPGIIGFLFHSYIKTLFTIPSVIAALTTGSIFMLISEQLCRNISQRIVTLDELTPKTALGIGFFECLALWPGFSRSAATIMGGMLLGAKRHLAAEYSFIAAVPVMFAATGYDLLKNWDLFTANDLPLFITGMICAFLAAWITIKVFILLISKISLRPFAYYRLLLAFIVYLCIK